MRILQKLTSQPENKGRIIAHKQWRRIWTRTLARWRQNIRRTKCCSDGGISAEWSRTPNVGFGSLPTFPSVTKLLLCVVPIRSLSLTNLALFRLSLVFVFSPVKCQSKENIALAESLEGDERGKEIFCHWLMMTFGEDSLLCLNLSGFLQTFEWWIVFEFCLGKRGMVILVNYFSCRPHWCLISKTAVVLACWHAAQVF